MFSAKEVIAIAEQFYLPGFIRCVYRLPAGDTGLGTELEVELARRHVTEGFQKTWEWFQANPRIWCSRAAMRNAYGPLCCDLDDRLIRRLAKLHRSCSEARVLRWIRGVQLSARGYAAERLFIDAWNDGDYSHMGVQSVRQATRQEDGRFMTDAFLTLTNGVQLCIQIKVNDYRYDYREFLERKIFLVQVDPHDSFEYVREKTIRSILRYKEANPTPAPQESIPRP